MQTILHDRPRRWALAARLGPGGHSEWGPTRVGGSLLETLLLWQERAQQRHALASLDDRMRRDMGLTSADIEKETRKPFWRA